MPEGLVRVCAGDRAPESFRALWDAVTDHHADLRPDRDHPLPAWEGERMRLAAAVSGDGSGFVVVAELRDELVGYARVDVGPGNLTIWPPVERAGRLETLSVAAAARGQGVGCALVDVAIAELAARQVPLVFVSFWQENAAAKRFYERCGFRADARGRHQRRSH
jgi:ribosomal protein S18 acetylase RimI-like enzyme